jgi:hypothetical protein
MHPLSRAVSGLAPCPGAGDWTAILESLSAPVSPTVRNSRHTFAMSVRTNLPHASPRQLEHAIRESLGRKFALT